MNKHDKNFLINMSPLLITAVVMFLMMVAFESKADDHNYTEHGILITEQDLQVKSIRVNSIRGYTIVDNDTIRVPQNITGSATDATQGGRPVEGDSTVEEATNDE